MQAWFVCVSVLFVTRTSTRRMNIPLIMMMMSDLWNVEKNKYKIVWTFSLRIFVLLCMCWRNWGPQCWLCSNHTTNDKRPNEILTLTLFFPNWCWNAKLNACSVSSAAHFFPFLAQTEGRIRYRNEWTHIFCYIHAGE